MRKLTILCCCLLMAACRAKEASPPVTTILCFGDSLTVGVGAPKGEDYPSVLASLTGAPVINAGISGELSGSGAERLPELMKKYRPSHVILLHGGNDMLAEHDKKHIAQSIRTMVDIAQAENATVVLLGMPWPGAFLDVPTFFADIAHETGAFYDGEVLRNAYASGMVADDLVHLNAEGYARVAEAVATLLKD